MLEILVLCLESMEQEAHRFILDITWSKTKSRLQHTNVQYRIMCMWQETRWSWFAVKLVHGFRTAVLLSMLNLMVALDLKSGGAYKSPRSGMRNMDQQHPTRHETPPIHGKL